MYQVNGTYDFINDSYEYVISPYSEDGYKGRLIDTTYEGGNSYTDWCLFHGDEDQCKEWIKAHTWSL